MVSKRTEADKCDSLFLWSLAVTELDILVDRRVNISLALGMKLRLLLFLLLTMNCVNADSWSKIGSDLINYQEFERSRIAISDDGTRVAYADADHIVVEEFQSSTNDWQTISSVPFAYTSGYGIRLDFGTDYDDLLVSYPEWNSSTGVAHLYKWNGSSYSLSQSYTGDNSGEMFGWSISFNSETSFAIESTKIYGSGSSKVTVNGNDVINDGYFKGVSIAESTQKVIVGTNLYNNAGGSWNLEESFPVSGVSSQSGVSNSMSQDGSIIAIGARYNSDVITGDFNENYDYTGMIKVFSNNQGLWSQMGQTIYGDNINDRLGAEVFLSSNGTTLAAITIVDDNDYYNGTASIYNYVGGLWTEVFTVGADRIALSRNGSYLAVKEVGNNGGNVVISVYELVTFQDSDGDGLSDDDETNTHSTDPLDTDSDDDGLSDGDEINTHSTDPLDTDSDGDGLSDGDEINTHSTDPNSADTSGDGLKDEVVVNAGFDPTVDYSNLANPFREGMTDLRAGSTIIQVTNNEASVQIQMEESSDLESWTETGDTATMVVPADSDTKFFRFKLTE